MQLIPCIVESILITGHLKVETHVEDEEEYATFSSQSYITYLDRVYFRLT